MDFFNIFPIFKKEQKRLRPV